MGLIGVRSKSFGPVEARTVILRPEQHDVALDSACDTLSEDRWYEHSIDISRNVLAFGLLMLMMQFFSIHFG